MFGQILAKLRKEKNYSQYKLAELMNLSRGQIANYEQGSREPDFKTLEKFANFFDVSIDYLLGKETGLRAIYERHIKPVNDAIDILKNKKNNNELSEVELELLSDLQEYLNNDDENQGFDPLVTDKAHEIIRKNTTDSNNVLVKEVDTIDDVAKRLKALKKEIKNTNSLVFDGKPMDEAAKEALLDSMELLLKQTQMINKLHHSRDDEQTGEK